MARYVIVHTFLGILIIAATVVVHVHTTPAPAAAFVSPLPDYGPPFVLVDIPDPITPIGAGIAQLGYDPIAERWVGRSPDYVYVVLHRGAQLDWRVHIWDRRSDTRGSVGIRKDAVNDNPTGSYGDDQCMVTWLQ